MLAVAVPVDEAALVVDALLLAAEVERLRDPALAGRYTALADQVGDALDGCPAAPEWPGDAALSGPVPRPDRILRAVPG